MGNVLVAVEYVKRKVEYTSFKAKFYILLYKLEKILS
jgi:hypothetical protein